MFSNSFSRMVNDEVDDIEIEEPLPKRPERRTDEEVDVLHVNTTEDVIEINNVRLFSFDEVALDELTNCTSLSMRKNLLHELTPFPALLRTNLIELDLFDNKIRRIGEFFNGFTSLTKVDLSYNQIKEISGLDVLGGTLRELYLVENKIKEIRGLDALVNLRLLELGGNRLREVGNGLKNLVNLEELWLGKNKISHLGSGFHTLCHLKRLSLQANRLTKIEADTFPEGANSCLEELYLSENGIDSIVNLKTLCELRILDFSFNPLQQINADEVNVATMPRLEEFWLTDGKISEWSEVAKLATFNKTLHTVYLERNPIEQDKRYRDKVFLELPFVTQIDSWPVVNKENLEADRAIHRR